MRWRTKVRISATLCLVCAAFAANLGQGAAADDSAPVIELSANHLAMSDAEAAAQRHLDRFLKHVLISDGSTVEGAAVKIAVPTGDESAEVIWITPFARISEEQYIGLFANEPQNIADAKVGDAIAFTLDQVRDWSFVGKDSKLYGSFTTRVLLPHIEQSEAARIAAVLSELPTPSNW